MTNLSRAIDLEAYRRDGFVVCHFPLFEPDRLDALASLADEYRHDVAQGRRAADLNVPHFDDARLFDWLMADSVLDLVEPIIGPDIALWTSQFFCKAPGTGQAIGWHTDGHYWSRHLDPVDVVSVWLALDAADAGNGGLAVVPGSHRRRDFRYSPRAKDDNPFFPVAVRAEDVDPAEVVTIELARGEFVVFDAWLLHGSKANHSGRRRCGFTLRYMPTSNRFHAQGRRGASAWARRQLTPILKLLRGRAPYTHRIYLARGVDHAGNRYDDWSGALSVRRTLSPNDHTGR